MATQQRGVDLVVMGMGPGGEALAGQAVAVGSRLLLLTGIWSAANAPTAAAFQAR